jgi:hypothetical protein
MDKAQNCDRFVYIRPSQTYGSYMVFYDRSRRRRLTAAGNRCDDHVTPLYAQMLAITSPTSGCSAVGVVSLRTKIHEVCFFHVVLYECRQILWRRVSFEMNKLQNIHNSCTVLNKEVLRTIYIGLDLCISISVKGMRAQYLKRHQIVGLKPKTERVSNNYLWSFSLMALKLHRIKLTSICYEIFGVALPKSALCKQVSWFGCITGRTWN